MSPVKATNEALVKAQKEAEESNKAKTGKGLRTRAGQTRGKNPSVISWDAFDDSQVDTLPTSIKEFMELTGTKDEPVMVGYLIDGFNSAAYGLASDELYEYVDDSWSAETQGQFRLAVRNFVKASGMELEKVVNLLKPAIDAQEKAKKEAAAKPAA